MIYFNFYTNFGVLEKFSWRLLTHIYMQTKNKVCAFVCVLYVIDRV